MLDCMRNAADRAASDISLDDADAAEESDEDMSPDEADEEQDAGDVRKMKKMIDPKMPSKEEVEAHEMVHLPFRSWCNVCIAARSKDDPHHLRVITENCQEVHLDYCFLRN